MSTVFLKVLNTGITAGWLILAVILARFLLRKAPKWISCVLWALVAVRLVCPFSLKSVLSLIPSIETIPGNIEMMQKPAIDSGITAINEVINPVIAHSFATDPMTSANPLQIVVPVLSIVWIAGMAAMLLYAFISYIRLKKSVGAAVPVKDNILACDEVRSPFILGLFKPLIYAPSSMSGETLDYVITHETAHIRRHDHWWKPLGFLLLAVYWFHPLCWIAYMLLCRDIEMACDERAVRNMDKDSIAGYSQALLDCSFPRRRITACPLAFGEVGVKERVRSVLNYKKPTFWIVAAAILVCIAVAVCFLTDPKTEPAAPDVPESTVNGAEDATNGAEEPSSLSVRSAVAYVGWSRQYGLFPGALNAEKMILSSVRHLPIHKIDSVDELEKFIEVCGDELSIDSGYDEMPSFRELTAKYSDGFFKEYSVLLVCIEAGSGTLRFGVRDVFCDNQSCCVTVEQLNHPESGTDDMAGWIALVEIKKADIMNITSYDAVLQ